MWDLPCRLHHRPFASSKVEELDKMINGLPSIINALDVMRIQLHVVVDCSVGGKTIEQPSCASKASSRG